MRVRTRPAKPEPAVTKNTEKALDRAKLPRSGKPEDDDFDVGALNDKLGNAPFDQRKIG